MARKTDCLVAGDANVDLVVEGVLQLKIGAELLAQNSTLTLGGSSSITAFNLSRLGASVRFVGVLGEDVFGRFVADKLIAAGVNVNSIRTTSKEKTGITIWHTRQGRRAGVTYAGTIALLERSQFPDRLLQSARHLHMGSYFLQYRLHKQAAQLFRRAKQLGLTTSLDCNYDPTEQWDSNLKSVLPHCDIFFPNEDEALQITRTRNAKSAGRALAQLASVVVVKQGAKGALVIGKETEFLVPARPTRVVDTTGAGDSFNAGFLVKYVRGESLEACAKNGAAAAARCVRYFGGTTAFE